MARRDVSMTSDEVREFLQQGRHVQVATLGARGWPHVAPMWYFVEDGRVVFRSFSKSQKIVNLRRDPRITVLVEEGEGYGELRGVMIRGTAELIDDREFVLESYRSLASRYPMLGGEPVDLGDDELEQAFGRYAEKNTAVRVDPNRVTSWDHRKLGGVY